MHIRLYLYSKTQVIKIGNCEYKNYINLFLHGSLILLELVTSQIDKK